jgi:hypothetical protein
MQSPPQMPMPESSKPMPTRSAWPPPQRTVIPAKVVRALGTEYGFRFTALSAEQRRQIQATLKERPAIPHDGAGQ